MKNRNVILFLLMINSFFISAQDSDIGTLIDKYIKLNLQSDIYYFLDFKKDEIPVPNLFYSNERITINRERSGIKKQRDEAKKIMFPSSTTKIDSNFIVFVTDLIDNQLSVEIFFNRDDYLNVPGKTEYDTWRRYNAGMTYLFSFDDKGYLNDIKKKPLSYD